MRRGILTIAVAAIVGVALVQDSPNDEGGTLEIRTEPQQALVSVSGPEGFVSMLDVNGSEVLSGLTAGRYLVVATAEGHAAGYAEVEVAGGAQEAVTLSLQPVSGQQPQSQQSQGQQNQEQQSQGQQAGQAGGGGQADQTGRGASQYSQHCAQCHGAQGEGGVGPALAGNQFMGSPQAVITQILQGGGAMPPFGDQLTDQDVAAVATHEMNSWGNSFGQVTAEMVAQVRGGGQVSQPQGGAGQQAGGGQQQAGQQQAGQGQAAGTGQGSQIYAQQCASCHGQQGGGGAGPALAGNQALQDPQAVVNQILNGGGGMPAFGNQLSDEQVAAVATHEMSSWGNSFGQVSAEQVSQARGGGQVQQGQQQAGQQQGQQQGQAQQAQGQQQGQASQQQGRQPQTQVSAQQDGSMVRVEITVPADAVPLSFTVQVGQASQGQSQQAQQAGQAQQGNQSGQQQPGQQQPGQQQMQQQPGQQQAQGQQQPGQQQSQGQQQPGQGQQQPGQQHISFTQTQAQLGGQEYFEHCAVCHGNDLLGRASYPPVAGEEFLSEWRGRSAQELFDFVSERMPQDRPGTLGHRTYVNLTAFLLQQYGFTPGQQPMEPANHDLASVQLPPPSGQPGLPPGGQEAGQQEGPPEGDQEQQSGQEQQQNQ